MDIALSNASKTPIYTGGSNDDDRVSSTTVFRQQGSPLRLPSVGSKANVILHVVLDLKLVASFPNKILGILHRLQ
jgi:hypothetical protein